MADKKNPHTGVIVKMSNTGPKVNCSLSVSVFCDSNNVQVGSCSFNLSEVNRIDFHGVVMIMFMLLFPFSFWQGPHSLENSGTCDYVSALDLQKIILLPPLPYLLLYFIHQSWFLKSYNLIPRTHIACVWCVYAHTYVRIH